MAEDHEFYPDLPNWYDDLGIKFFQFVLHLEEYVSSTTLQIVLVVWILLLIGGVALLRSGILQKFFARRQREQLEKEHPRAFHSRRRLLQRYVSKGLNDDIFFTNLNAKEDAALRATSPFTIQQQQNSSSSSTAGGAAGGGMGMLSQGNMGGQQQIERKLFISVGSDSDVSPYTHEDCDRMSDLFVNKLGYKEVKFTSRGNNPSSVNLAQMAKQLKLSGRSWDHVVVFVAAKTRVCEVDRSYLAAALKKEKKSTTTAAAAVLDEAEEGNGKSEKFPFFFLEFLADQTEPEDPKNWVDIHMLVQRVMEGSCYSSGGSSNTDFTLIADCSYCPDLVELLPTGETTETTVGSGTSGGSTTSPFQSASFEKLLWEAGLSRHIPLAVLGAERFVIPGSAPGKKPKYTGSVLVRRIGEAFAGTSRANPVTGEPADEGSRGEAQVADMDEPNIAFPTAHGTTRQGIYHQGIATIDTLHHHLSCAWPEDSPAEAPFWFSPLHDAPVLGVQEALMPRLALQSPVETWRSGSAFQPHSETITALRQELVKSAIRNDIRTSSVLLVKAPESCPGGGQGITCLLKELSHTGHMIRRDIVYLDLALYQTAEGFGCKSTPQERRRSFDQHCFVKLITDLGRVMVALEHPITSVDDALAFSDRVLSAVKAVLILDHVSDDMVGAKEAPLGKFLRMLCEKPRSADDDDASSTPRKLTCLIAGSCDTKETTPRTATFTVPSLAEKIHSKEFSPKGFISGKFPGMGAVSAASSVSDETLEKLGQASDVNLWAWKVARGLVLYHGDSLNDVTNAQDLIHRAVSVLSLEEKALLRYLIQLKDSKSGVAADLRIDHISASAATVHCGSATFDSIWDSVLPIKNLNQLGLIYLSPFIHSWSFRESRLHSIRVSPILLAHLEKDGEAAETLGLSGGEEQRTSSRVELLQRILTSYAQRVGGGKLNRQVWDGFSLPGLLHIIEALSEEGEDGIAFIESVLPSTQLTSSFDPSRSLQPSPYYKFISESVKARGIQPVLEAIQPLIDQKVPNGVKKHALAEILPLRAFQYLEKHTTALKVQPNEFFQVLYNAVAAGWQKTISGGGRISLEDIPLFTHLFPKDWFPSALPEVSSRFRRNILAHSSGLKYFNPPVFALEMTSSESFTKSYTPKSAITSILTDTATSGMNSTAIRTLVGFKNGDVAVFHMADWEKGEASLNKLSKSHSGQVDVIMRYGEELTEGAGDCQIVTAARAIHEILVWSPDLKTCEKVPQLTKAPGKRSARLDKTEEESSEEDEDEDDDYQGGNTDFTPEGYKVTDVKRRLYLHLVSRSLDEDTLSMYRRSAGDDDIRRHEDNVRPMKSANPMTNGATEIAVISVGEVPSPHSGAASGGTNESTKQKKHETVGESVKMFNQLRCNPVDPVGGLLSISTPNNYCSWTCGAIIEVESEEMKEWKEEKRKQQQQQKSDEKQKAPRAPIASHNPRIVLGTSDGELKVYKLVALPRFSALP